MANAVAASIHQIAAVSGHKTLKEIERYTRTADQRRLAREALLGPAEAITKISKTGSGTGGV